MSDHLLPTKIEIYYGSINIWELGMVMKNKQNDVNGISGKGIRHDFPHFS